MKLLMDISFGGKFFEKIISCLPPTIRPHNGKYLISQGTHHHQNEWNLFPRYEADSLGLHEYPTTKLLLLFLE